MPLPVLVSPLLPLMIPESVSCVPPTSMVELPPSATVPAKLLLPVLVLSVPPLSVTASVVEYATFWKSSTAPLATVAPPVPSHVPNALFAPTASVPAFTWVPRL